MKDLFFLISFSGLVYGYTLHLPTLTILSFALFVVSFPKVNIGFTPSPTPNHPPSNQSEETREGDELKNNLITQTQITDPTQWEEVEYLGGRDYRVGDRVRIK